MDVALRHLRSMMAHEALKDFAAHAGPEVERTGGVSKVVRLERGAVFQSVAFQTVVPAFHGKTPPRDTGKDEDVRVPFVRAALHDVPQRGGRGRREGDDPLFAGLGGVRRDDDRERGEVEVGRKQLERFAGSRGRVEREEDQGVVPKSRPCGTVWKRQQLFHLRGVDVAEPSRRAAALQATERIGFGRLYPLFDTPAPESANVDQPQERPPG